MSDTVRLVIQIIQVILSVILLIFAIKLVMGKNKDEKEKGSLSNEFDNNFITPPNHVNFKAKKLFGNMGEIIDGSIAYVDLNGGGPTEQHTHEHNHLFIVTKGEAKIKLGDKEIIVKKDESYLVEGKIPHSVWNNIDSETIMIGISVKPRQN